MIGNLILHQIKPENALNSTTDCPPYSAPDSVLDSTPDSTIYCT